MNRNPATLKNYQEFLCPVCAGDSWSRFCQVTDTNQGVPGDWTIQVCPACGLGRLDPMPKEEEVNAFYREGFYTEDKKRFNRFVEMMRSFMAYLRYRSVRRFLPEPGRLLDLGAGAGHFGSVLKKKGWAVFNEDVAYKGNRGKLFVDDDQVMLDFPDGYFDVVSLWYVVEHLLNPGAVLKEIRRVLKTDGVLITAQQDFDSFQARFFRENWLMLDPPRHIYQFSQRNLQILCEQHGLEYIALRRCSLEFGPFTIYARLYNKLFGNKNYLFNFLKSRSLNSFENSIQVSFHGKIMGLLGLASGFFLFPLILVVYYVLLISGSSDVFTLILRKQKNNKVNHTL